MRQIPALSDAGLQVRVRIHDSLEVWDVNRTLTALWRRQMRWERLPRVDPGNVQILPARRAPVRPYSSISARLSPLYSILAVGRYLRKAKITVR